MSAMLRDALSSGSAAGIATRIYTGLLAIVVEKKTFAIR